MANDDASNEVQVRSILWDYNRKAKAYWWVVVVLGTLAGLHALLEVSRIRADLLLQIMLGIALVAVTAAFPVRLRKLTRIFSGREGTPAAVKGGGRLAFSFGDFYVFLLLFGCGLHAATLAFAVDAFIGARRASRRSANQIASPAIATLSLYASGQVLLLGDSPLVAGATGQPAAYPLGLMLISAVAFAGLLFVLDAILMLALPMLRLGMRLTLRAFVGNYGAIAVWTMASAGFAFLLVFEFKESLTQVMLYSAVPFAVIVLALRAFAKQQEAYLSATESEASSLQDKTRELLVQHDRFQSLFEEAAVGMAVLTREGRIQQANGAFGTLLGIDPASLVGEDLSSFVDARDVETWNRMLRRAQGGAGRNASIDLCCRHDSGRPIWLTVHCSRLTEQAGALSGLIVQAEDSTARQEATKELHHLAYHDGLTGIPNRRRFAQLLGQAVATAREDPAHGFALLFLDFDGFKRINDTMGHDAGDRFLVEMAARMRDCVRPSDTVARLGGDEFAILLPLAMPDERSMAAVIAERIVTALAHPLAIEGQELRGRASIGIVTSARSYASESDAIREADAAMYRAKAGKSTRIVSLEDGSG